MSMSGGQCRDLAHDLGMKALATGPTAALSAGSLDQKSLRAATRVLTPFRPNKVSSFTGFPYAARSTVHRAVSIFISGLNSKVVGSCRTTQPADRWLLPHLLRLRRLVAQDTQ